MYIASLAIHLASPYHSLSLCIVQLAVSGVFSVVMTTVASLLWFFTGWYLPFVLWFGGIMGYLLTAVVLFTPVGECSCVYL